jgi:hypothetical protein
MAIKGGMRKTKQQERTVEGVAVVRLHLPFGDIFWICAQVILSLGIIGAVLGVIFLALT